MSDWKNDLEIKKESLKLSLQQTGFTFGSFLSEFPPLKRRLFLTLVIGFIPAVIIVRIGAQKLEEQSLKSGAIAAHASYVQPTAPKVGAVNIFQTAPGIYAAYADLANNNVDLVGNVPYTMTFKDSSGSTAATITGSAFLLPNEKKILVAPRIQSINPLSIGTITVGDIAWRRRLSLPEVDLKTPDPLVSNQNDPSPTTLVASGAVVNNSPYHLGRIRLTFLVYNQSGKVIAVSQRDENDVAAFARRAYIQTWPDVPSSSVSRIAVQASTDTSDGNNVVLDSGTPAPAPGAMPK